MDMPDKLEQNISETIQLQDLPGHVLTRIFVHLDYRERIRLLESVSRTWRALALDYAWRDQHILRFSREMLRLDEPWKDKKRINSIIDDLNRKQSEVNAKLLPEYELFYTNRYVRKEGNRYDWPAVKPYLCEQLQESQRLAMREYSKIFTDPALYKQEKPSRQLAPLKAVIHRCAPFLDEFHLHNHFDIQMRFGRIFHQLTNPSGRLAHLHIDVPLDSWHLRKIQCHLAPQLLSLAVVPIDNNKSMVAFRELLANCNKLENLQIAELDDHNLFDSHSTFNKDISIALGLACRCQAQPSSSCCSFLPSTLKCLLMPETQLCMCYNPEKLVNRFVSLVTHCSQLRYMPILINAPHILDIIEEKNPREFDKIISLQLPFFITNRHSFPFIKRPEFCNLKALHVTFKIGAEELRQIAKYCPQLEHLGIRLSNRGARHKHTVQVEISDLVTLHQFQRLSSLEILMGFEVICPGGERADMAFLDILNELDQISPLRSLDFKAFYLAGETYPSLSQDYLLQMSDQLKHLETFSCGFYVENLDIDDTTGIGQFCEQLEQIFDSQEGANKKSFEFKLLANAYEWDNYRSREKKNLLVKWQKGNGTRRSKMNPHCIPGPELTYHPNEDFEPSRSIVLNELITSEFGPRTSSMLFDSFGMMMEEEH